MDNSNKKSNVKHGINSGNKIDFDNIPDFDNKVATANSGNVKVINPVVTAIIGMLVAAGI
ncbi:TPA: hypothetical protein ACX3CA_003522 [Vibrio parahaemolyticus]